MPKKTFYNLPEEKREGILEQASILFAKYPIQDISINKLIKAMNISTGSFYQYFTDKEDLYFCVLSRYMDSILEESRRRGIQIDLFDREGERNTAKGFTETRNSTKYYDEIFVENFNKAPLQVKRDWILERLIGRQYMEVYDDRFLCQPDIPPEIQKNRKIILGMAMAIPVFLQNFVNRVENREEYVALHRMCIDIIKAGVLHYADDPEEPREK